jgi:hypothetical protein
MNSNLFVSSYLNVPKINIRLKMTLMHQYNDALIKKILVKGKVSVLY